MAKIGPSAKRRQTQPRPEMRGLPLLVVRKFGNYILDKTTPESGTIKTLYDLIRERGKLLSLFDLLEFMNNLDINVIIDACLTAGAVMKPRLIEAVIKHDTMSKMGDLIKACEALDCPCSARDARKWADLTASADESTGIDARYLKQLVSSLQNNLRTELSANVLLYIERERVKFWENPFDGWSDVLRWLPDTANDIEGASRCLAMSQPTATVFHLARIGEHGLRKVCLKYIPARQLPPPHRAMMGKYIEAIDKFANVAPPLPRGAVELASVVAHFSRIKNVWRDKISHTGVIYTEDQAERCYNAIRDGLTECATIKWPI